MLPKTVCQSFLFPLKKEPKLEYLAGIFNFFVESFKFLLFFKHISINNPCFSSKLSTST